MNDFSVSILKKALQTLSHEELLELIVKLIESNEDVKQAVIKNLQISLQFIAAQPRNPQQIKNIKQDIDEFIKELQYEDYEYGDREFTEFDDYPQLDAIIQKTKLLHPKDQIDVYFYMLTKVNKIYGDFPIGTVNLEDAFRQYGQAVKQLALAHTEKRTYFDLLVKAFVWEMSDSGGVIEAVKQAIDIIADSSEDYHYVIDYLKLVKNDRSDDLIAEYYLKLHEDENYLKIRMHRMLTEEHYLELAQYWKEKGDDKEYRETLERWVTKLSQERKEDSYFFSTIEHGVLQKLLEFYIQQKDDRNTYRILMAIATYNKKNLDLYKQLQNVSSRLGNWKETKHSFISLSKRDIDTLAEVYIYEKDYQAAIKLAKEHITYHSVVTLVSERVKQDYPKEAISLYEQIVQEYIDYKKRNSYHEAADYARKIKFIYEAILKDPILFQKYLSGLRMRYKQFRALQDELKKL